MDDFLIRPATLDDVKPMTEMDQVCSAIPWSEKSFFEEITRNKVARYVIAEAAGRIAGYAGMWAIIDEGHITNVAVHPDFRRRGIARTLISTLLTASEAEGVSAYTLEVRASNEIAISLYSSLGFQAEGVRRKYYEDDSEDAIIMWKGRRI